MMIETPGRVVDLLLGLAARRAIGGVNRAGA
jgi:hypothetical protein